MVIAIQREAANPAEGVLSMASPLAASLPLDYAVTRLYYGIVRGEAGEWQSEEGSPALTLA